VCRVGQTWFRYKISLLKKYNFILDWLKSNIGIDMKQKNKEIGSLAAQRSGSGNASWAQSNWHKSDVLSYPASHKNFENLQDTISQFCLNGHIPLKPCLHKDGNVVAIGSCFAAELRHFLNDVGLSSDSFWIPSGLNNSFALLDFFSWVITGEQTSKGYGYSKDEKGSLNDWEPELERETYKAALENATCFVFTLGLAEVWEDLNTGKVFWRGIPEQIFVENRHHFRLSTVSENASNILLMIELIRKINPMAPVVLTLSPVPLKATFSEHSCVTSDCVSKSTLRLAIHEVIGKSLPNIHYWPSFEVVKWLGCHLPYPVYGTDDNVIRHVSRYVVIQILHAFVTSYYGQEVSEAVFVDYLTSLTSRKGNVGEPPVVYSGQIVTA
jgi:hypothetical protein